MYDFKKLINVYLSFGKVIGDKEPQLNGGLNGTCDARMPAVPNCQCSISESTFCVCVYDSFPCVSLRFF